MLPLGCTVTHTHTHNPSTCTCRSSLLQGALSTRVAFSLLWLPWPPMFCPQKHTWRGKRTCMTELPHSAWSVRTSVCVCVYMCVCVCVCVLVCELRMNRPQKSALPVVLYWAVCSICVLCVLCGECALFCSPCRFELLAPSPWGTPNGSRPLFIHLAGTGDHVSSVCCVVM